MVMMVVGSGANAELVMMVVGSGANAELIASELLPVGRRIN